MYVYASGGFVLKITHCHKHIETPFAPRQDEVEIHFAHC